MHHRTKLITALSALAFAACSDDKTAATAPDAAPPTTLQTLDGKPPLIIAHRGFPGIRPEETQPSYELAADFGADALEEDLHLSKDCVLVARHNPWLSDNTNIAQVAAQNPDVAARKRTVPGRRVDVTWPQTPTSGPSSYLVDLTDPADPSSVLRSLVVDGEEHVGDWSITDFTAHELQTLLGGTTYDAKAKTTARGRSIAVYPETKNPTWNNEQAIANGCGAPGSHPLEDALIKIINDNGLNSKDAPIFVQSFEPSSLQYMRDHGLQTKLVQLIDAYDTDFKTGTVVYNEITDSRPYDWTIAGDARWFDAMLTPAGLAEIAKYADGIGPWKPMILPLKISPYPTTGSDGMPYSATTSMASLEPATSVISDAHKANLFVHIFTFRNEPQYLAKDYAGNPDAEFQAFLRLGADGVFTDFTSTGVSARENFMAELGQTAP